MRSSRTKTETTARKAPAINPYRKRTVSNSAETDYRKKSARKTKTNSERSHPADEASSLIKQPPPSAVVSPEVANSQSSQKSSPPDASVTRRLEFEHSNVLESLNRMPRIQLESICRHALQASQEAHAVAERLWQESQARIRHCIRCHTDFDPRFNGRQSCVWKQHDDTKSASKGSSPDKDVYACGHTSKDTVCWKGPHTIRFLETSPCWLDQQMRQGKVSCCASCQYGHDCRECCTCRRQSR